MGISGEIIAIALAAVWFWRRSDLRRQLFWGGVLSLPIIAALPSVAWQQVPSQALVLLILTTFSLGVIATGVYESFFRTHVKPISSQKRKVYLWLCLGPIVFLLTRYMFNQSSLVSLIIALFTDFILVLALKAELIWDAIFSAVAMAGLYLIVLFLLPNLITAEPSSFWLNQTLSGLTLGGLAVEGVVTVALFGALWGPIYAAVKDLQPNS